MKVVVDGVCVFCENTHKIGRAHHIVNATGSVDLEAGILPQFLKHLSLHDPRVQFGDHGDEDGWGGGRWGNVFCGWRWTEEEG